MPLVLGRSCRSNASPLRMMKRCSLSSSCLCCLAVACGPSSFSPLGNHTPSGCWHLRPLSCPTWAGSLPSRKSYFSPRTSFLSVLAAFHCTFTGSTTSFCLINNNVKPLTNTKLFICTWCNVLVSPELR